MYLLYKTKRFIITSAVLFFVTSVVYSVMWYFVYREQQDLYENSQLANDLLVKEKLSSEGELLLRTFAGAGESISDVFLSDRELVVLLEDLESLASEVGVIFDITSVGVDSETAVESIGIKFTATGKWENVIQLVSLFELLPHLVTINTIRLDSRTDAGEWNLVATMYIEK
jgi:hypothetical protein